MNAPFLVRPDRAHEDWWKLTRAQRRTFLGVVGIRAAVREYGLSALDVALALDHGFERSYARVLRAIRDDPAAPPTPEP